MDQPNRDGAVTRPIGDYEAPELTVHGTVADLTRGQGGRVPDSPTQGGSFLPDDSEQP